VTLIADSGDLLRQPAVTIKTLPQLVMVRPIMMLTSITN